MSKKFKFIIGMFLAVLFTSANIRANELFYYNDKPAQKWHEDGKHEWYYFVDGKKHTGYAIDGNGNMHFTNGKYTNGYHKNLFYDNGRLAQKWYDDKVSDWYYFVDGKKHNGYAVDGNGNMHFTNGKYSNGFIGDKFFIKGKESQKNGYVDELFYDNGKLAQKWYDDKVTGWYYFVNGKKHNGYAVDGNGNMHFTNGKYTNGYHKNLFYDNGRLAQKWYDDKVSDWYYFVDGKKHNGYAVDGNGNMHFTNGKYSNGFIGDKFFIKGKESQKNGYVDGLFYDNGKLAQKWYDDKVTGWYYFVNGKKHNGYAVDGNGNMHFTNGKYTNGYHKNLFYDNGRLAQKWYDDKVSDWYYFVDGKKHN